MVYISFIHETNLTGGAVVEALSALLKELWFGNTSSIAPSEFKEIIGELAPHVIFYLFVLLKL